MVRVRPPSASDRAMTARLLRIRADYLLGDAAACRPAIALSAIALCALAVLSCQAAAASEPHPAVARIIVPEHSATSFGTGTLIDVRQQYGLVVTNWHVVRDAARPPEVVFPNGFRSAARPLKLDANWDLAALVIWRPPIAPVPVSQLPPRPGDRLTICGYGQGDYRAAAGRCTQYYAPRVDYPHELLELDVEARQGDSGGPIFNAQGELAGVLFGAGRGTTMGSYGGRVHAFLASLAPDIGKKTTEHLAEVPPPRPNFPGDARGSPGASLLSNRGRNNPATLLPPESVADRNGLADRVATNDPIPIRTHADVSSRDDWVSPLQAVTSASSSAASMDHGTPGESGRPPLASLPATPSASESLARGDADGPSWIAQVTTVLAVIGAIAVVLQFAKLAGR